MEKDKMLNQRGCAALCADILNKTLSDYKNLMKDKETFRKEIYNINNFAFSEECSLYCALANVDQSYIERELEKIDGGAFRYTRVKRCKCCGDMFFAIGDSRYCSNKCARKEKPEPTWEEKHAMYRRYYLNKKNKHKSA